MTETAYTMRFDYQGYLDEIASDRLTEARWKLGVALRQKPSTDPAITAYWEQVRAAATARIGELMKVTVIEA